MLSPLIIFTDNAGAPWQPWALRQAILTYYETRELHFLEVFPVIILGYMEVFHGMKADFDLRWQLGRRQGVWLYGFALKLEACPKA